MSGYYVDNAMNRRLGRVGMPYGSAVHSRSSVTTSTSSRVYVDNAENRRLGRVGLPHGTAVHSRSSGDSSTSSRFYVDNAENRRLGRVGLPHGTAVNSRSSGGTLSSSRIYVDNYTPRCGKNSRHNDTDSSGSSSSSSSPTRVQIIGNSYSSISTLKELNNQMERVAIGRTYVDNAMNRRLGRVGLPIGSAVYTRSTNTLMKGAPRTYVDNAYNRQLGRVGLPIGSFVVSKSGSSSTSSIRNAVKAMTNFDFTRKVKCDPRIFDFNEERLFEPEEVYANYVDEVCEEIENLKNLRTVRPDIRHNKDKKNELKPEQTIAFNELAIGDKIGSGGFGDVHIALWKGLQVAVKKLRVQRVQQSKKMQFEDEVRNISALDHPNIVKFYGACMVSPNLVLVMEFLPDGSLYDNLYYSGLQFHDDTKNQFIRDCFSALIYIHSKNMVHRDIKSKNIMLYDDKSRCKLADFGTALKDETESNASTKHHGFAGTEKYCPKEVLEGEELSVEQLKSVDVYSLALTTFKLLTEEEPFGGKNIHQIRKAITKGDILKTLAREECDISKAKKDLLNSALSSPRNRPSAADFLKQFNRIIAAKY